MGLPGTGSYRSKAGTSGAVIGIRWWERLKDSISVFNKFSKELSIDRAKKGKDLKESLSRAEAAGIP